MATEGGLSAQGPPASQPATPSPARQPCPRPPSTTSSATLPPEAAVHCARSTSWLPAGLESQRRLFGGYWKWTGVLTVAARSSGRGGITSATALEQGGGQEQRGEAEGASDDADAVQA